MNCEFCGKPAPSINSQRAHRVRCVLNPNRVEVPPSYGNRGKVHSPETRKLLSAAAAKRHVNGPQPPPLRTGWQHSPESREKIAHAMQGNRNANHRGDRQSYYRGVRMDSGWEVKTAEFLDQVGLDWKYSVQGFTLSDGSVYYPDFFVYRENGELGYLIEVKGYFRDANREKFQKFLDEYPDIMIELWQKDKLKAQGII